MTAVDEYQRQGTVTAIVPANAAMWRLRSLVALGHSAPRIARALGEASHIVQKLIAGETHSIAGDFDRRATALWEAWWCSVPPETIRGERCAATMGRQRAAKSGWCCPAGLDEDMLSVPGYRPCCRWRHATGLGVATDNPLGLHTAQEQMAG